MWARLIEMMLGIWLLLSPFIFRNTERADEFRIVDACTGIVVVVLSLLSFWHPLRLSHLATGAVAVCLILSAYFTSARPGPPAAQNEIVIGLLLLMLCIVPNE